MNDQEIGAQKFLEEFSLALESFKIENILPFYQFPVMLISDQGNVVVKDQKEMSSVLAQNFEQYKQYDFAHIGATLHSAEKISDTLVLVKVILLYTDSHGRNLFDAEYRHILQRDENNQLRISASVIVNEVERVREFLNRQPQEA